MNGEKKIESVSGEKKIEPAAAEVIEPEPEAEPVSSIGTKELVVLGALAAGVGGLFWYNRHQAAATAAAAQHAAIRAEWVAIDAQQAAAGSRAGRTSPGGVLG